MTHKRIPTYGIEDGFDRQNLSVVRKRFAAINADRLQRMHRALAERHQLFLDVLPMLFHCNHPMLPGFVSRTVPAKISGFKPSEKDIAQTRLLARSFTLRYDPAQEESIYGIYVMGSVGTIAQSNRSDLDVWLCHKPGLSSDQLESLQEKCTRISQWADKQRLEAHFFLMDYEAFKKGKLSSLDQESSGSAQRLLLLDEFYRSAIHVAGRTPLWWYVPEKNEKNYDQHAAELLRKRFINSHDVLDFGGVASIPEGEFIGAGIWQLYKAIDSPYKSVLKLLLLEIYVSEYPNICPLSLSFKEQIFHGELDIDKLDSYAMIYRRIEAYLLEHGQTKRLELARRCFYFKVNRALSRSPRHAARPWQREQLKAFTDEWGWPIEELEVLDQRRQWKAPTVSSERSLLVNELNHSYQFLLDFAQRSGSSRAISAEELTVLGRKLQAAFERRPGKIEWINPNISKDLSEDLLTIRQTNDSSGVADSWTVFSPSDSINTLRTTNSFVELILWCLFNGIIESQTQFDLGDVPGMTPKHMSKLLQILSPWLPKPTSSARHEDFQSTAKPQKALLLLNVGAHSSEALNSQGLQRLSEQSDALHYGGREENLVLSADLVTVNSWHEVHARRFSSKSALLDALREFLQLSLPGTHQKAPELQVECIGEDHASIITHRVKEWFSEITQCFYSQNTKHKRYLFQLGGKRHILYFKGMRPNIEAFSNERDLIQALAQEQDQFSGLNVDSRYESTDPVALIASKMKRNTVSVFYRYFDIGMETYISDEKGSIVHALMRGQRHQSPLVPLHRFLRAVIARQARTQPDLLSDFGICPIYFFQMKSAQNGSFVGKQTPVSQNIRQTSMFEVKAIAHTNDAGEIEYDFYCDDQEFSSRSFQDQLFLVVAQFILSRRKNGENYPIYITDLDLSLASTYVSGDAPLQIKHYLDIKNVLEDKLNEAIGVLVKA